MQTTIVRIRGPAREVVRARVQVCRSDDREVEQTFVFEVDPARARASFIKAQNLGGTYPRFTFMHIFQHAADADLFLLRFKGNRDQPTGPHKELFLRIRTSTDANFANITADLSTKTWTMKTKKKNTKKIDRAQRAPAYYEWNKTIEEAFTKGYRVTPMPSDITFKIEEAAATRVKSHPGPNALAHLNTGSATTPVSYDPHASIAVASIPDTTDFDVDDFVPDVSSLIRLPGGGWKRSRESDDVSMAHESKRPRGDSIVTELRQFENRTFQEASLRRRSRSNDYLGEQDMELNNSGGGELTVDHTTPPITSFNPASESLIATHWPNEEFNQEPYEQPQALPQDNAYTCLNCPAVHDNTFPTQGSEAGFPTIDHGHQEQYTHLEATPAVAHMDQDASNLQAYSAASSDHSDHQNGEIGLGVLGLEEESFCLGLEASHFLGSSGYEIATYEDADVVIGDSDEVSYV
ncbi:Hypothetical Protein FCC1311_103282 [Hondaea fermentalgiana]|uniref:Uncharacterized protein n=1 Tax=Hondaea fermentalgiana TaxID=2315210 RepID=A0A2R5GU70_9STRA|nr:Hypothetical Protein FCC1311_103282 [Hondaea fermentalgiana]|eukprot:GBG34105.1 Hypothetical Protein FCC1311_103282 [Hondaea fermentalgiana]